MTVSETERPADRNLLVEIVYTSKHIVDQYFIARKHNSQRKSSVRGVKPKKKNRLKCLKKRNEWKNGKSMEVNVIVEKVADKNYLPWPTENEE